MMEQKPWIHGRKVGVWVLMLLTVYACASISAGFPLGFGKLMTRSALRQYCSVVYPQAQLGENRMESHCRRI